MRDRIEFVEEMVLQRLAGQGFDFAMIQFKALVEIAILHASADDAFVVAVDTVKVVLEEREVAAED